MQPWQKYTDIQKLSNKQNILISEHKSSLQQIKQGIVQSNCTLKFTEERSLIKNL